MSPADPEFADSFPRRGSRARLMARFARDLHRRRDTAEGRFAVWPAREPCRVQAARRREAARDETGAAGPGGIPAP